MENNNTKIRMVNGVRTHYAAGQWYCDFKNYASKCEEAGRGYCIEGFINWCDRYDLSPT